MGGEWISEMRMRNFAFSGDAKKMMSRVSFIQFPMATDPRPYRVRSHHRPGERTRATLSLVVPGAASVGATSVGAALLRGFLDGDGDVDFPPECRDRAAAVRCLAATLPKLFWARRHQCALALLREEGDMHSLAVWWERDDARAMLRLARRYCRAMADVDLLVLLERRVRLYDRQYGLPASQRASPWWKGVVDAHLRSTRIGDAPCIGLTGCCTGRWAGSGVCGYGGHVLASSSGAQQRHKEDLFPFDGVNDDALRRHHAGLTPSVEACLRCERSLATLNVAVNRSPFASFSVAVARRTP